MSTPLTERGMTALRHLTHTTHLATLPPIQAAFDEDRRSIDLALLDDWPYSSGELVLVSLMRAIATDRGGPEVAELFALDSETRTAALDSIMVWLGVRGGAAWQE